MLDALKEIASWGGQLALLPKLALSFLIINLCFFALVLLWYSPSKKMPWENQVVISAYERMARVLDDLPQGVPSPRGRYYEPYLVIADFIDKNPGDVKGAYEVIWENGGRSRTFINETNRFETVVSGFFRAYQVTEGGLRKP